MKMKKIVAIVLIFAIVFCAAGINFNTYAKENKGDKHPYKIYLKAGTLEPGKNILKKDFKVAKATGNKSQPYIIAFTGPITDAMKDSVTKEGVKLLDYLPDFSFISFLTSDIVTKIKEISCVADVVPYEPQYRIDPDLLSKIAKDNKEELDVEAKIRIITFDTDLNQLDSEIAKNGATKINSSEGMVTIKTKLKAVSNLLGLNAVKYIEEAPEFKLNNDIARGIVGSESIETLGYEGSDQIVSVADTGLDTGISGLQGNTLHADFSGRVDQIIDKSGDYQYGVDGHGHGTHVAGSVLGSGQMSGGKIKGTAPKANLIVQQVGNSSGSITYDDTCYNLFKEAYGFGARIHTNSWGADLRGKYTSSSSSVDKYVWEYQDATVLFSAGNNGTAGHGTIGSPGSSKNCITVGSTINFRPYLSLSTNPDDKSDFSSHGTQDGRIKPDVVAPGEFIASAQSSEAYARDPYPGNPYYQYMSGTSMSTPVTAGAVAVIREYIQKNYNITNPSAALIKAFVINGALTSGYSEEKGWGKVSLYDSLLSTKVIDHTSSLDTYQKLNFTANVTNVDKPLKISLVWSDYPGIESSEKALVNDLDLKVTAPNGTVIFNGNDFTAPYNSEVDRLNNVETVTIDAPQAGTYTIEVSAFNVVHGPQPFALVYSADFFSVPKNVRAVPDLNSVTLNWDAVPGATSYDVELDGGTIVNITGLIYTHSNLPRTSLHNYRVRAKNAVKTGDWSNTVSIYTTLDAPNLNVETTNYGLTSSWNTVSGATTYDVYVNGTQIPPDSVPKETLFALSTNEKYTTFNFIVRSRSDFNFGNSVPVDAITLDGGVLYKKPMNEMRADFGTAAGNGKIYAVGGKRDGLYLNTIEEYDIASDSWSNKTPMTHQRAGLGVVEANGKIYAIGGFNGSEYSKKVEEYDPALDRWVSKTDMPTSRAGFGVAYINNKIYVIGGTNGSTVFETVDIYDPVTDTWASGAEIPTPRSNFGISILNGKIVVVGGMTAIGGSKAVEEYDPIENKWTIKKNMPEWNSDFGMTELGGKLFASGGKNSNCVVEFDAVLEQWSEKSKFPAKIYGNASVTLNDKLYILGGFDGSNYYSKVIEYDTARDDWSRKASMVYPRSRFTSVALDGKIYAFGGLGGTQLSLTELHTAEVYDVSTDTWTLLPDMSEKKVELSAAVLNDKIYITGGTLFRNPSIHHYYDTLEEYDPVTNEMTVKAQMPERRLNHESIGLNGYLYVIGGSKPVYNYKQGYYQPKVTNSVLRYDPANDTWTTTAPLPTPRWDHVVGTANGKIYVIGGVDEAGVTLDSVEEYDPATNTWTTKNPLPEPRRFDKSVCFNDKIYLFGSMRNDDILEYDPVAQTLVLKGHTPYEAQRYEVEYLDNKIYVFGGLNSFPVCTSNMCVSDEIMTTLSVGSSFMEPRAGKKTIPVTISNVPSEGIYKADVVLNYDPSKLMVTNATAGEVIPGGYGLSYTVDSYQGKVTVTYTGDMATQKRISADGVLTNIEFDVLDSVNSIGTTELTLIKDSCKLYKTPTYQYTGIKLNNCSVDIFIYGDVDGSSSINSTDSSWVKRYILGINTYFPYEYGSIAGDVDGDGRITSTDKVLIDRYVLGIITKFPVQQ